MILRDFARQVKKFAQQTKNSDLFSVLVYENEKWEELPERHHQDSLAIHVAIAEAKGRNCPVSIFKYPADPSSPVLFVLSYWPMGILR
jgi:hypothetical protein